jgi:hypothetical protein
MLQREIWSMRHIYRASNEKAPPSSGGAVRQSTHAADADCSAAEASGNSGSLPKQTAAGGASLTSGLAGLRYEEAVELLPGF